MESYKKNENPTLEEKQRALVELDREHGVGKCEVFSMWTIYDRRNHPGKLKKGRKVETFIGADSEPTITRDDNANYSPISLDQAAIMAEDSCGDFSDWLYSEPGFLIVTDGDGETLSPGLQAWYTFTRYCGWRRNVWRKVTSTIRANNKPLAESTLRNQKERCVERFGKHLDSYQVDYHGNPVSKLSQSFISKGQRWALNDYNEEPQAETLYYSSDKETTISRSGLPCESGWITTPVSDCGVPLNPDGSIHVDTDIMEDHEPLDIPSSWDGTILGDNNYWKTREDKLFVPPVKSLSSRTLELLAMADSFDD